MSRQGCGRFNYFFFQAEDGIRDADVTGVQTCALPIWRGSIEKFEEKLHKKITKLIISLNKEYSPYGIIFNEAKKYKVSYLKKIKVFLNEEITSNKIQFVHGKGKRKTALQRHFEKTDEYITKLNEYQTHLEIMGPTRNSYSKTDHDATFMRMKEDHMQNQQLK